MWEKGTFMAVRRVSSNWVCGLLILVYDFL
jgi:hypothetical protein